MSAAEERALLPGIFDELFPLDGAEPELVHQFEPDSGYDPALP